MNSAVDPERSGRPATAEKVAAWFDWRDLSQKTVEALSLQFVTCGEFYLGQIEHL